MPFRLPDRRTLVSAALILIGATLLISALSAFASRAPASAAAGDPLRGAGVVSRVIDGDTIEVVLDGDSAATSIRLAGIQAFERGECGADIATARLTELVDGERVELRSRSASSSSLGRPVRSVHLVASGGGRVDVTERLLRDGMGLWFPMAPEITDTDDYHVAATLARAEGRGIWRDRLCGTGPQDGHPIEMWAKSDADSDDGGNVNDEYVRIVNRHPSETLDLAGWILRESSQFPQDNGAVEGYHFPSGSTVPAGGVLTVRVGSGTDSDDELFMGSSDPLFDNADRTNSFDGPAANTGVGDGVYLLDTRGNVREAFTWPCVVDCSTDLHGKLVIDHAEYDPSGSDTADNEYVELRNASDQRIRLDGYQLRNISVAHEFTLGTWLDPGERLRVTVGHGQSTRLQQYWGQDGHMLRNSGDRVDVLSFDERYVDCADWGSGRDCPWPVSVPGADAGGTIDPGPFADVSGSQRHVESIEWLVEQGITSGCGGDRYCPDAAVTRAQMATFLDRALELAPGDGAIFDDVPTDHSHLDGIGALVEAEITSGCGDGDFCPATDVTRAQMATFLTRGLELAAGDGSSFADVPRSHRHVAGIGALVDAGVTSGCGSNRYCPDAPVTRAQMATFLKAALEG